MAGGGYRRSRTAFGRAVKRIPPKDRHLLRKMQSERFADYRRRLFGELAGREKSDPANPGQKVVVRPEVAEVDALVARLAAIDRQEADLYGLNAKRSDEPTIVVNQPISEEEMDIQLARLTEAEKDTLMMLVAKMQGRWVEPPSLEEGSIETTATTMRSNGVGS
jgi:hypothetical protein